MFPAAVRRGDLAQLRTLNRICRVYAVLGLTVPVFGLATAASLGVLTDAWLLVSIALTAVAAVVLAYAILPAQAAALTTLSASLTVQPPTQTATPAPPTIQPTAQVAQPAAQASQPPSQAAPPSALATPAADLTTPAGTADLTPAAIARRLGMVSGIFNLLWATVVVLMIVRPGSTTGA
ncbi:hypothetical protein [Paractinoplanes lichenicola]|uniref:hypothetical protein n=1 Tax=Paractinoplanes lichenicola TaxID=2802976 RepID=UPI003F68FBE7